MNAPVLTYIFMPVEPEGFAELDDVRLLAPARTMDGEDVPAGAEGTVLGVWAHGKVYDVEFDAGLATVDATHLARAE